MPDSLFDSEQAFRDHYFRTLESSLDSGPGALALACANALIDQSFYAKVAPRLKRALSHGTGEPDGSGDSTILRRAHETGLDQLGQSNFRHAGGWPIRYNSFRALRPAGSAQDPTRGIHNPFDSEGFHFNKPFLGNETVWEGEINGGPSSIFYNKYPVHPCHCLYVPSREEEHPQLLTEELYRRIWRVMEALGANIPALVFGYNSVGAYSSVNHLHVHMTLEPPELPVAARHWTHNGGDRDYPVKCTAHTTAEESWDRLRALHDNEIAYNWVYVQGAIYILPRRHQGTYQHAPWTTGFGWYEMAGGVVVGDPAAYESLSAGALQDELKKLALPA